MQRDKLEKEQAIFAEKARELENFNKAQEIKVEEASPKKEAVQIIVDEENTESEADDNQQISSPQKSGIAVKSEFYQNQQTDLEKEIEAIKLKINK
jgi:hypothetical protein